MRLFIAEKPAMGKTIASFLSKPHISRKGYIETGDGFVTWCIGHLLQQPWPAAYGKEYDSFPGTFDNLPIVPEKWKVEVSKDKKEQLAIIKGLLEKCDSVVHAGDPGREGQMIVDEVLEYLRNKKPVRRIILSALDEKTVRAALGALRDNTEYAKLYDSALGRQRADWLVGMNLSRAYSILGYKQGYGVLSIGRVQTPTLAIVVKREKDIQKFVPTPYFSVQAQFSDQEQGDDGKFLAIWVPPGNSIDNAAGVDKNKAEAEALEADGGDDDTDENETGDTAETSANRPAWMDEAGRVIDKATADKVVSDVLGAGQGTVADYQRKEVREQPPAMFDLADLQGTVAQATGKNLDDVLKACQSLYDQGYMSYPRTDCPFMPESHHAFGAAILDAVASASPKFAPCVAKCSPGRKSPVWSDKKTIAKEEEHHGIVPTDKSLDASSLAPLELAVWEAVAQRYIEQFLPECVAEKTTIQIDCGGHRFAARGRVVRDPGWRAIRGKQADADKPKTVDATGGAQSLPALDNGSRVFARGAEVKGHQTTPPARYTQKSLMTLMKKVYLLMDDPEVRKKLKATKGIGRSSSRTQIIMTLINRNYLEVKSGKLIPTDTAFTLVDAAPPEYRNPATTAMWETALDGVACGQIPLHLFEQKQVEAIRKAIEKAKTVELPPAPESVRNKAKGSGSGGGSGKSGGARKSAARKAPPKPEGAQTCPKCKKGWMQERAVRSGAHEGKTFFGCTRYPDCKHSEWPK